MIFEEGQVEAVLTASYAASLGDVEDEVRGDVHGAAAAGEGGTGRVDALEEDCAGRGGEGGGGVRF